MADIAILPTSNQQGSQFEQSHVQNVYNEIASRVNDIQHKAWPNVKRFIKKFEPGALIADIGCGNGRYLSINKKVYKIGVDVCKAMVDNSREKGYEVAYADNLNIPFRDDIFDGVISIGVVHHFCSAERRIQALRELARVLQPGGRLMLYVWAYEQKHRKFDSQDVLVPWHEHRKHRLRAGSTSSRHSSIGGLSSASSLSEDDSVDQGYQPTDNGSQTASPHMSRRRSSGSQTASPHSSRRRSSASLDDLTSVLERSSFKPSYYSLDFTHSPGYKKRGSDYEGLSRKMAKQNVVSECKKLEASLRAMSLGSFEEIKHLVDKDEFEEKGSLNDVFIDNTIAKTKQEKDSLNDVFIENTEAKSKQERGSLNDIYVDNTETKSKRTGNKIKMKDVQQQYILTPQEDETQIEHEKDCKFYIGTQNEEKENKVKNSTPAQCSKINPFLKKNSMDAYTFNNILKDINTEQVLGTFIEEHDALNDPESMDEVSVNFKPERIASKSQSESFISSLKSKFLKIFSDESAEAMASADSSENILRNEKFKCARRSKSSACILPHPSGRSELTVEQQEMAQKLDFKVREFPQSSCPNLKDEFENFDAYSEQCQNKHSCIKPSQHINSVHPICQKSFTNFNNKSVKDVKTTSTDTDRNSCDCKRKTSNENEILSHIYDGYIKIDLDISKDRQLNEIGALQTALNAKQIGAINNNTKNCDNGFTHFTFSEQLLCNDFDTDLKPHSTYSKQCNIYNETSQNGHNQGETVHDNDCGSLPGANDISHQQCNSNAWPNHSFSQDDDVTSETDTNFSSKLCRYYHVFREGEIEALIATHIQELQVLQCYYDHANWCVVAEKV